MTNPFISVHKPAEPVFGSGTVLMKIPLDRTTGSPALTRLLCWLAIVAILLIGGAVLGWSAWRYAGSPAVPATSMEPAVEESGEAIRTRRDAVRTLIMQVMGQSRSGSKPLPELPFGAEGKEAGFDFSNVRQGEALRRLGDRYAAQGQATAALQAYCNALKKNPKNQNAWQSLGGWYIRTGDYEMAKLTLETAFRLGAVKAEPASDLAALYRREGRLGEALALWEQSRSAAVAAPLTELNEGLALIEKGEHERAAICLERCVENDPSDILAARALAYAQVNVGEWAEARWTLKRALAWAPESSGLRADAAAVAAHGWLVHEALEHLEALVRLTSPDVTYQYLQTPAFSGFRQTALGRGLESVLLVSAGTRVVSPEELREQLYLDLAPRFSTAP